MRLLLLVSVCDNTPSVPSACFHMRLNVSQSITARSPSLSLSAVCLSLILPPLYLFLFIVVSLFVSVSQSVSPSPSPPSFPLFLPTPPPSKEPSIFRAGNILSRSTASAAWFRSTEE